MLTLVNVVIKGRMTRVVEKGMPGVGGGYGTGIADASIGKLGVIFKVRGVVDQVGVGG